MAAGDEVSPFFHPRCMAVAADAVLAVVEAPDQVPEETVEAVA